MIFLIEYNRSQGKIVTDREFDDFDRRKAEEERLRIELTLNHQGLNHEVVLLEAASREQLRTTHRRYFGDLEMPCEPGNGNHP